ncbi:tRNA pseudouridine(55) synthase TruB [Janibacter sp. YIM B02568]|uniref:tRNA pseudouridine(55) synthase TruB n=1 Tax=Janibacter endophyticus TaxID=2806261 RepID=UPI00194E3B2B|nr:tRNA pseudouridine(55) synthase TruB [Janibacter endophyticus]MBM6546011.1 tRNA pseudouridine(55) synthase TruB [Janibacter endophyticus]
MSGQPARGRRPFAGDGLVVVDKPAGWTSHDVVGRCRRLYGTKKVGHAGTLDPMATGVLVLGVGRATRLLTFLVGCDKEYAATIRLGQETVTDDAEGEVTTRAGAAGLSRAAVDEAVAGLTGEIAQVPSAVSAIKVDGQRSYARVRSGEQVELAARPVTIETFEVLGRRESSAQDGTPVVDLDVHVAVSSGTYVRALARDLGAALGTGGHLTALRRTRVGGYTLEGAVDLEALSDRAEDPDAPMPLLPLADAAAASLVVRRLDEAEARALGYGQRVPSAEPGRTDPVAALGPDGALVAVLDESRAQARAHVVFAPAGAEGA